MKKNKKRFFSDGLKKSDGWCVDKHTIPLSDHPVFMEKWRKYEESAMDQMVKMGITKPKFSTIHESWCEIFNNPYACNCDMIILIEDESLASGVLVLS